MQKIFCNVWAGCPKLKHADLYTDIQKLGIELQKQRERQKDRN